MLKIPTVVFAGKPSKIIVSLKAIKLGTSFKSLAVNVNVFTTRCHEVAPPASAKFIVAVVLVIFEEEIFSTKFIVEVDDAKRSKRYKQTWYNNMDRCDEPIITKLPAKTKSSVKITFYPDLVRFKINDLNKIITL